MRVNVDITEECHKHDHLIKRELYRLFELRRTRNKRWIVSFAFHIDDIDNFTYFGSKTTASQQLEIKKRLFTAKFERYNAGAMPSSKVKFLDAVDYPNYCVVTSRGVFYAMSDDMDPEETIRKESPRLFLHGKRYEAECSDVPVSSNAVNKIYYDQEKDELCVKLLQSFRWIVDDTNAPAPLKKRYIIAHGNRCRLIAAKITDPKLVDKVRMENIKDLDRRTERYFELLREWKGFIIVCVDITAEFNQFQERIKNEYIEFHTQKQRVRDDVKDRGKEKEKEKKNMNEIKWDNRKYFLNSDKMPFLKYNKKEDKITHDVYILLNSKRVQNFDAKFNFFSTLTPRDEKQVLEIIFAFVNVPWFLDNTFGLVCRHWHRLEQNWRGRWWHHM